MNWRTYNSLRRTEGHRPGLPAVPHLTSGSALGLRPWGQGPYPRKDSRWRTGLYFYNIKDQEVPSTVLITGVAALVTDTCTVEPAHCCTQGCWAPLREAELSPDVRTLKSHCSPSPREPGAGPAREPLVFGLIAAPGWIPGVCARLCVTSISFFKHSFPLVTCFLFRSSLCFCSQTRGKAAVGRGLCVAVAGTEGWAPQLSTEAGRGLKALGAEPWSRSLAWVRLGQQWDVPPQRARGPLLGTGAAPLR